MHTNNDAVGFCEGGRYACCLSNNCIDIVPYHNIHFPSATLNNASTMPVRIVQVALLIANGILRGRPRYQFIIFCT